MPHSSGGGSHSGGSHSSHSSHSGGSHGGGSSYKPKPVTVMSPRRGYSRYAYYSNGHISYQYVKDKPESIGGLIVSLLFYIPFFIVGLMVVLSGIRIIDSIDPASYDSNIIIEDSIDVISDSDEMELQKAFEVFRDKTGISCALITADNETWSPYYSSLENYAYDLYVNHWTDEKHWLFVYTQPVGTESSSGFVDWYWEGMQGDDTDSILTSSVTDDFNEDVQRYLTMNTYSVGDAFTTAITDLTGNVKASGIRFVPEVLFFGSMWFLIIGIQVVVICATTIPKIKKDKEQIDKLHETGIPVSEHPLEDTCAYCGGLYIHGVHLECPHCGAAITPMADPRS